MDFIDGLLGIAKKIDERSAIWNSIKNGFTAPSRAYYGQFDVNSPEGLLEAMGTGGLIGEGALASSVANPVSGMALGAGGVRRSAADTIAMGYKHPVGAGKNLRVLVKDMTATRVPVKDLPEHNIISPEAMQGGVLIPASGDRTAAGQMLTEINGTTLPNPVYLEGGADFMRTHKPYGEAWASNKGAAVALSRQIQRAASGGKDVYMPYVAMGNAAGDFSTMMSDALLEQILGGKFTKKSINQFDSAVREMRPEWAGLLAPDARKQLESNGALRTAFVDRMQLDPFIEAGFPDIPSTRFAITEPKLLDVPYHTSGFSIAKMDSNGRIVSNPVAPHKTYDTHLAGDFIGGLEVPIPRDVMFPDFYNARRAAGKPASSDFRAFDLSRPMQDANQQWLDGVMNFIEMQKKGLL